MNAWNMRGGLRISLLAVFLVLCFRIAPAVAAPVDTFDPILADFDGDNKVDQATLSSSGVRKTIHVTLGRASRYLLAFDSGVNDRGTLLSADIDGDGDIDLLWIATNVGAFRAWVGDGSGNFSAVTSSTLDF